MVRARFIFLWLAMLFAPTGNLYSNNQLVGIDSRRSTDFIVFEENGKVGLKDKEGDILIPAAYDAIGWSNGKLSIVDKVVGYQSGGLWGLIHTSNKVLTEPEFLDLKPGEGSFLVAQKKSPLSQRPSFGIINTSGKTVIPFIYDALQLANMRAVVMSRTGTKFLFGLIDLSHKVIIPLEYQRIHSLGSLRYAVENFENKTAIFSDAGAQVTAFNIDSLSAFKNDYAIVYQGQKQGLIDRDGRMLLNPIYREVQLKADGTIHVRETDEWFLLEGDNKLISQHNGDEVRPLSPDHYALVTAGKLQLNNNDFKPLQEDLFSSITDFRKGIARFRKGNRTGLITTEGRVLVPPQYQEILIDDNPFRACLDNGNKDRWIILDSDGRRLTERHYERIERFNGKFYPVKNRGYWGALNALGVEIITCVHDSLVQEAADKIVVKFKGEYGIINLNQNWIVTPRPHLLKILNEDVYFEYIGNTTFLKSFSGDIIYFSDNPLEYHSGYVRELLSSGASWLIDMNGIIIDRSSHPALTEKIFSESEGLRAILKDGKFGFIDSEGRLRIANRYEEAKPFSEGVAAIRIRGKWGFIDHQERLVIQPVYDEVENFNNGKVIVKKGGLSGLIDGFGKVLLPLRYNEITVNDHNRFVLRQGKTYGLADAAGAIIIQPRYDDLSDAGNGYVIVSRDGKFGVLTLRGVSTIPMIYDRLTFDHYHNNFLAVKRSPWQSHMSPQ